MKQKPLLLGLALITAVTLAVSGMALTANANTLQSDTENTATNDNSNLVPGDRNAERPVFWEIDEYKDWMETQRAENQKLADSGDMSFYEKDGDGNYVCRAWTQQDVDALYATWQEQLAMMEQGYHFTKPIELSGGGTLAGAVDPETWNADVATAPGSTIITMPDGSTVDLGHFDTASEATAAVKEYLEQQVEKGVLTHQEADAILARGATEQLEPVHTKTASMHIAK